MLHSTINNGEENGMQCILLQDGVSGTQPEESGRMDGIILGKAGTE